MLTKAEKFALAVSGIEIIGCLVWSAMNYARSQYYQGRIDARKEMFTRK